MNGKAFNQAFGRPALQVICGYEFAALNSNGKLQALTGLIWWLRDHNLTWLAWLVVVGFQGWVFHHLLLERTGGLVPIVLVPNLHPQEERGTGVVPPPPFGQTSEARPVVSVAVS